MNERKRVIDLTWRMARRSISSEFKGTALGRAWSFINPLATIAVFSVIFGLVFRGGVDPVKTQELMLSRCGSAWALLPGTLSLTQLCGPWIP